MNRKRKNRSKQNEDDDNGFGAWGGYMEAKKSKLLQQYKYDTALCSEKLSDIFKDVAIFVNGLTRPNGEELKVLMTKHGGVYHTYQMSTTTHIIASNLAHTKIKHLGSVPIVKPQWITESIDVGKLIDYKRYLLYTNQSATQPRLQFPVIPKPTSTTKMKEEPATLKVLKENEENTVGMCNTLKTRLEDKEETVSVTDLPVDCRKQCSSPDRTSAKGNKTPFLNLSPDLFETSSPEENQVPSRSNRSIKFSEPVRNVTNLNENINKGTEELFSESADSSNEQEDSREVWYKKPPEIPKTVQNNTKINEKRVNIDRTNEPEIFKPAQTSTSTNEGNINGLKANPPEIPKAAQNDAKSTERKSNIAKTAADPTFLKEFYNNSRLHLISTLGAEFKQLVNDLREKSDGKFAGKEQLMQSVSSSNARQNCFQGPVIMHIDMDCFFVSVGVRTRPHLRNKPVAVTHGRTGFIQSNVDREAEIELRREHSNPEAAQVFDSLDMNSSMSEVASCSYEARLCGVKNGMFLGTAMRLCPDLQTIPYDFQGYREVSTTLYKTVASYTLDIEAVSCDEMYVDVTKVLRETGLSVEEWATHVRSEITEKTQCPCSAGFGANRLQARLATKKAKPAGQYHLMVDDIKSYMYDIPLSDIPGVGYATLSKLKNLGLNTCGDVQMSSLNTLKAELGQKNGETLYQQARGIDNRPLNFNHQRKTVSTEVNYGIRFTTLEETYGFLKSLSQEVFDRLSAVNMKAKCVTLKVLVRSADAPVQTAKYLGHGLCDSYSKSTTVNSYLTSSDIIFREIKSIYDKLNVPFVDLRGLGIHLTKLEKIKRQAKTLMNFCKIKDPCEAPNEKIEVESLPKKSEHVAERSNKTAERNDDRTEIATAGPSGLKTSKPKGKKPLKNTRSVNKKGSGKSGSSSSKCNCASNIPEAIPSTSHGVSIDLDILKELPEEIQREIAKEYKIEQLLQKEQPPENEADQESSDRKPKIYANYQPPESNPITSPFHTVDWEELKSVIRNWMNAQNEPNNVDTEMLGSYCRELAELRKIEYLKMLTSFLYRVLSGKGCKWHKAYFTIVNTAQQGMVARYGSTLLVDRAYRCCQNNC